MIGLFAERDDQNGMTNFVKVIGIDSLFSSLADLINSGIDESFVSPHILQAPSEKHNLLNVARELEEIGHLQVLSSTLESCTWKQDDEILLLRAKLICLQSQIDEFCAFLSANEKVKI